MNGLAHRHLQEPLPPTGLTVIVDPDRSEEHTSELQSQSNLVCRLLLEKKKTLFETFWHAFLILLHTNSPLVALGAGVGRRAPCSRIVTSALLHDIHRAPPRANGEAERS